MSQFRVTSGQVDVEVEAESMQDAREMAFNQARSAANEPIRLGELTLVRKRSPLKKRGWDTSYYSLNAKRVLMPIAEKQL